MVAVEPIFEPVVAAVETGSITGRAYVGATEKGLPGVAIVVNPAGNPGMETERVLTDEKGEFAVPDLLPGQYTVPLHRFRGQSTDNLKVIERFSRVAEETVLYQFRIEDPATYTEPWGGDNPMTAQHDRLFEYACHEGNYALANILSGARYQESVGNAAANERD